MSLPTKIIATENDEELMSSSRQATRNGKPYWQSSTNQTQAYYRSLTIRGLDVPNYHKLLKSGDLIPHTPYYHFEEIRTAELGNMDYTYVSNGANYHKWGTSAIGEVYYSLQNTDIINPSVNYEALVQGAAAKIQSSGWDALTFTAELTKLIGLFTGLAKRLPDLVGHVASGRIRPRELSNLWLEGRYGWRTLIYDMLDLHNALTEFDAERKLYSDRVGYAWTYSDSEVVTTYRNSNREVFTRTSSLDYDSSFRGSVSALIVPAKFRTSAITTGWEIIPFSFIVDWFLSVGAALDAAQFASVAKKVSASQGFVHNISKIAHLNLSYANGASGASDNYSGQCHVTWKDRTPTSVPLLPQFNPNLDVFKVMDLLALTFKFK